MELRAIGAPMDLGADRRGVDMGPSALRYAGLSDAVRSVGVSYDDAGDLPVPRPEGRDPNVERPAEGSAKYLRETRWVCRRVESAVADAIEDGAVPLVLGGDHSIAIGSVNGASAADDVGVLWLDAHGDFNTPATSPSGNVHGMPVAAFLGRGVFGDMSWATADVDEENVAMVGLRSIDGEERTALRNSDVTAYTMSDVDTRGLVPVVEEAIEAALDGVDTLHVSLDMDFLDPDEAPGVGTPVRGGVSYREAHAAMELVAETGALGSMEVVEVNPILDSHNRTADLAVELVSSCLGKRIL
ncbi:arginase [Natronomonas salina]|uniref:arginase n=1 Tax=Natronomonas salina TaxID=1710540 RepID=UPI0015B46FCE|nr:arginase [Natronomonas salina]QLD87585.1 arginase [Natronomonas salina]